MITDRIEFVLGFVWITASEQVLGFWFKTYDYMGMPKAIGSEGRTGNMSDIVERMKTALRETMKEVDTALGQVEQSVVPNWNWMREVRERARAVLVEAEKLGPAEVVFIDKHDGEKFADGMIYSSTEKPSEAPWKGESRHQALLIPILDQLKEPT